MYGSCHPRDSGANQKSRRPELRDALFRGSQLSSGGSMPRPSSTSSKHVPSDISDDDLNQSPSLGHRSQSHGATSRKRRSVARRIQFQDISNLGGEGYRTRMPLTHGHDAEDQENTAGLASKRVVSNAVSGPNLSRPLRRHHRRVLSRENLTWRSYSGRRMQDMGHFEPQLAVVESQDQSLAYSFGSAAQAPSSGVSHTENQTLQEEVKQSKTSFTGTRQDQRSQYELVKSEMSVRLATLESGILEKDKLSKELQKALVIKEEQLAMAEIANRDLERRLEFMSKLVATSPGEMDLHLSSPHAYHRKRTTLDPTQRPIAPLKAPSHTSFSRHASKYTQSIDSVVESSAASNRNSHHLTCKDVLPEGMFDLPGDGGHSIDLTDDIGDSATLFGSQSGTDTASTWRQSMPIGTGTGDVKRCRPPRRMRRFYTGSVCQSLILPSRTNSTASQPASAIDAENATPWSPTIGSSWAVSTNTQSSVSSMSEHSRELAGHTGLSYVRHKTSSARVSSAGSDHGTATTSVGGRVIQNPISETSTIVRDNSSATSWNRRHGLLEKLSRSKYEHDRITSTDTITARHDFHKRRSKQSQASQAALSDMSTFTDPADEPEIDPDYHSLISRPCARPHSSSSISPHLPTGIRQILTVLLHPLSLQLPFSQAARLIMSQTWQTLTVSRPVLEFRIWLVRLLLGRLRIKHGAILLFPRDRNARSVADIAAHSARASGLGLGAAGARSRRSTFSIDGSGSGGGEGEERDEHTPKQGNVQRPREAELGTRPLTLSLGDDYEGSDWESDGEPSEGRSTVTDALAATVIRKHAHALETERHREPPGVGWLRFSATVVAAVGLALVEGPQSLLDGCRKYG